MALQGAHGEKTLARSPGRSAPLVAVIITCHVTIRDAHQLIAENGRFEGGALACEALCLFGFPLLSLSHSAWLRQFISGLRIQSSAHAPSSSTMAVSKHLSVTCRWLLDLVQLSV